jgi:REP element-mobilizing transposase RayT
MAPEKTMQFTNIGSIAHQYWCDIPHHFPFVELDAFVVMPNHVHGIIVINKIDGGIVIDPRFPVETRLIASLQNASSPASPPRGGITGHKNPMIHENLSKIIRWYKGGCSFEIRKNNIDFAWQPRFYDRVIRDHHEYCAIKDYIENNIDKWDIDSLH